MKRKRIAAMSGTKSEVCGYHHIYINVVVA
jgi:hypothetical protein